MGYIGAKNLKEINKKAKFVKITKAGLYESMVHSVEMTQKLLTLNCDEKNLVQFLFYIICLTIYLLNQIFLQGINLLIKINLKMQNLSLNRI